MNFIFYPLRLTILTLKPAIDVIKSELHRNKLEPYTANHDPLSQHVFRSIRLSVAIICIPPVVKSSPQRVPEVSSPDSLRQPLVTLYKEEQSLLDTSSGRRSLLKWQEVKRLLFNIERRFISLVLQ
jgi:hypothetical protein